MYVFWCEIDLSSEISSEENSLRQLSLFYFLICILKTNKLKIHYPFHVRPMYDLHQNVLLKLNFIDPHLLEKHLILHYRPS